MHLWDKCIIVLRFVVVVVFLHILTRATKPHFREKTRVALLVKGLWAGHTW